METKGIFLWCSPRCVSTAFECCIRQLPNVKCFHEAFAPPKYIGPENTSHSQYSHMLCDDSKSFASIAKKIEETIKCGKYEAVFSRDMAYYLEGHFDILLQNTFKMSKHGFLVRHPANSLSSFHKACGGNYVFDANEAGFKQQYEMYKFVKEQLNDPSPVVVDIGDVLMDPEGMMQLYCEAVGLKYQPGMTCWSSTPNKRDLNCNDGICDGWHEQVFKSTGLQKSTVKKPLPVEEELPDIVKKAIKEQMPFYEALYAVRLKPKKTS